MLDGTILEGDGLLDGDGLLHSSDCILEGDNVIEGDDVEIGTWIAVYLSPFQLQKTEHHSYVHLVCHCC